MAMGIVSDSEFDSEQEILSKPKVNSVPVIQPIIVDINRGRGKGNVEVPNGLRQIIGETAISDGRQEAIQLAKSFGISPSSASAYAKGSTSTTSYQDQPNKPTINSAKERIAKSARNKLRFALAALTSEKISEAKAIDISTIARNMAAVVKQMEPETPAGLGQNNGTQFILYAPVFQKEDSFEVVYAKE